VGVGKLGAHIVPWALASVASWINGIRSKRESILRWYTCASGMGVWWGVGGDEAKVDRIYIAGPKNEPVRCRFLILAGFQLGCVTNDPAGKASQRRRG
jgi:hypothetical protein